MKALESVVLVGTHVWLEPLEPLHVRPLLEAASESRATYAFTHVPGDEASMRAYVDGVLAQRQQGLALPFTIVDAVQARVVGTTRFLNVEYWTWPGERAQPAPTVSFEAAEIGGTWLAESAQRTPINTEAKLLLFTLAFETWKLRRVNLKTDVRNARSRAAIERLGARLEGFLRAHMPASDGGVRDTALYSLLASEWPAAKAALELRLNALPETTDA
jgi:RimJ/RimL family protein N-acetyltransferase